jgi:ABC-2 type transport system permease protein
MNLQARSWPPLFYPLSFTLSLMFQLFLAELKRGWIQFIRYSAEAIGGVVITTAAFYGLFLSASYAVGPGVKLGDRLDAIIVGYVLWSMVTFIMFDIAGTLQSEAQTGTLEQLFISPFGAAPVFLLRAIANFTRQLLLIIVILGLIMGLTGRFLAFPPILLFPLITVVIGAYGFAFMLGGITLIVKRVQQVLGIVQFALLFLLTVPIETWTGTSRFFGLLLPMGIGAGLLRDVMARNLLLDWPQLGLAIGNSAIYLAIGLAVFRWAERHTKRNAGLSGY